MLTEEELSALEEAVNYWIFEHNMDWPGVSETHDEMLGAITKLKLNSEFIKQLVKNL